MPRSPQLWLFVRFTHHPAASAAAGFWSSGMRPTEPRPRWTSASERREPPARNSMRKMASMSPHEAVAAALPSGSRGKSAASTQPTRGTANSPGRNSSNRPSNSPETDSRYRSIWPRGLLPLRNPCARTQPWGRYFFSRTDPLPLRASASAARNWQRRFSESPPRDPRLSTKARSPRGWSLPQRPEAGFSRSTIYATTNLFGDRP